MSRNVYYISNLTYIIIHLWDILLWRLLREISNILIDYLGIEPIALLKICSQSVNHLPHNPYIIYIIYIIYSDYCYNNIVIYFIKIL